MDWVKRNLGFVIGSVVAIGLLLFSGFYLYSNSKKNTTVRHQLEAEYAELQRLSNLSPHPGKGDVDNISRAKEQKEELLRFMQKVDQRFKPIPAIPPTAKVTGEDFSAGLRRTIDQLNRQASVSSVIVPTNYNFSFEAEKRLVKFAPGSLPSLAVQVGEVKAICGILFAAKVNKITGLRRERVSPDDRTGPQSDYLATPSITNDLAVITPYEVSFESFSAELSDVIAGFANSPHGIVIKGFNVEPARTPLRAGAYPGVVGYTPSTRNPEAANPIYTPGGGYGAPSGEYEGPGAAGAIRQPTFRRPTFGGTPTAPYGVAIPQRPQPTYTPPAGGYRAATMPTEVAQTLIDEHPLSVTMVLEVIKLLPPQEE